MNDTTSGKTEDFTKLLWTEGPLRGFFVDFKLQEIGFEGADPADLEYRKICLLRYLAQNHDRHITAAEIQQTEELNSIDLSKNISVIKSTFLKLKIPEDAVIPAQLFELLIDKKRISGSMGYRLLTEHAIRTVSGISAEGACSPSEPDPADPPGKEPILLELSEEPAALRIPQIPEPRTLTAEEDAAASALPSRQKLKKYFEANWFPLFLWLLLFLSGVISLFLLNTSLSGLYARILRITPAVFLFFLLSAAAFPTLCGLFPDSFIAVRRYRRTHGKAELTGQELHNIIKYGGTENIIRGEGRFDNSMQHVCYALFCNLSAALCILCFHQFMASLPERILTGRGRWDEAAIFVLQLLSLLITLLSNFKEQTRPAAGFTEYDAENPDVYLLTRFHAFSNTLFLSFSIGFSLVSAFTLLTGFAGLPEKLPELSVFFPLLQITAAVFFWFSSLSPAAGKYEAVCSGMFLFIMPLISVAGLLIAFLNFAPSPGRTLSVSVSVLLLFAAVFLLSWMNHTKKIPDLRAPRNNVYFSCLLILILFGVVFLYLFKT